MAIITELAEMETDDIQIYRRNAETNGHSIYYSVTEDMTEGRFLEDQGKFDPRTRPWYSLTKEAGKPIFSPLYKHFVKDDLVLTSAYPIYNKEGKSSRRIRYTYYSFKSKRLFEGSRSRSDGNGLCC